MNNQTHTHTILQSVYCISVSFVICTCPAVICTLSDSSSKLPPPLLSFFKRGCPLNQHLAVKQSCKQIQYSLRLLPPFCFAVFTPMWVRQHHSWATLR